VLAHFPKPGTGLIRLQKGPRAIVGALNARGRRIPLRVSGVRSLRREIIHWGVAQTYFVPG
jgi:hypothetical protein